jgi:putative membrane protein
LRPTPTISVSFAPWHCSSGTAGIPAPHDRYAVRLLPQLDLPFLQAVIATGLLHWFFLAKGVAFYAASQMFWIKMALFAVVGLLSLPPTFAFVATRKAAAD